MCGSDLIALGAQYLCSYSVYRYSRLYVFAHAQCMGVEGRLVRVEEPPLLNEVKNTVGFR